MHRRLIALLVFAASAPLHAQAPPNIVLMDADNLGFGEVGVYGSVRGVPTPRIDALAGQGLRLTNFNVETFCTPSRTALLTGRYGIRSGTLAYRPPVTGMTLWEVTIAELLKPLGYATAAFGKWHVGDAAGRADASGIRRVVRHPRFQQRVAAQHLQRHAVHLGRQGRSAVASGEGVHCRHTGDARPRSDGPHDRLHETEPERRPALLRLRAVHPHPLPDAAASRLRGHNRRRRCRGCDGGNGPERWRYPRRDCRARDRAEHDRDLGQRWRCRGQTAMAGHRGSVERLLQHGDGRRHPHAVHDPLARTDSGRTGVERHRARHRHPADARRRRRRGDPERSRDRRDQPADILRGETATLEPRQLHLLRAGQRSAGGQMARLEAALRLAGSAARPDRPYDAPLQPAGGPEGRHRHQGLQPRGDRRDRPRRGRFLEVGRQVPADSGRRPGSLCPLRHVAVRGRRPAGSQARGRNDAQHQMPNLSGKWKRVVESDAPPQPPRIPATAGSGWGDEITIAQDAARLTIERAQFSTYDMQPPMRLVYALDGSETRNVVNVGRGPQAQISRVASKGSTLIISTRHGAGTPLASEVTYMFSLDGTTLVIEMTRPGGVHPSSTTRARYQKAS